MARQRRILVLICSCICSLLFSGVSLKLPLLSTQQRPAIQQVVRENHPSTVNCTWKYFTQPLDHFSPGAANVNGNKNSSVTTFQQRYCLYDKYFNERMTGERNVASSGQPPNILFYTGNESPVEEYVNQTGLMWTLAPKLNSLVVFAEHRYFGESVPQLKGLRNCLSYCTTQQALADHALLVLEVKKNYNIPNAKVVAFGGSYGGMLASWARIKYPNVFDGAIAGSAPVWGFPLLNPPLDGATQAITRSASKAGGATDQCKDNIRTAWPIIYDIGKTQDGRDYLSSVLNLCEPLQSTSDVDKYLQYAQALWFDLAEGDYPFPSTYITFAVGPGNYPLPAWPVRVACEKGLNNDFGFKISGNTSNVTYSIEMDKVDIVVDWDITRSNGYTINDVKNSKIDALLSSLQSAVGVWYNVSGTLKCFDVNGDNNIVRNVSPPAKTMETKSKDVLVDVNVHSLVNNGESNDDICTSNGIPGNAAYWNVICCNENLNLVNTVVQGVGNDMYWPPNVGRDYTYDSVVNAPNSWLNTCNEYYDSIGLYGVSKFHDNYAHWDTMYYGGKDIASASNIVFSNGLLDPWSSAGVLHNVSDTLLAVIIDLGGHHLDLFFPTENDPESVIKAREIEEQEIRKWIGQNKI
eukprot:g4771.t1